MSILLAICVGLGLAAASGFRVFLPLFGLSLAAKFLGFHLSSGLMWLTHPEAMMTLGVATVLETGAYYIPWLDNILDTIATPAAAIAGTLAAGAVFVGVDDPVIKWGLAVIAGGGVSSMVQVGTVATRAASTATTGGLANPVVATGEWVSALVLTGLSIFAPVLAVLAVLLLAWAIWKMIAYVRARKANPLLSDKPGL